MSVKRYEVNGPSSVFEDENGSLVDYEDYAVLEARCAALAAENAVLKVAVTQQIELRAEIKKAGRPPHADFWVQSICEAEEKVKRALEDTPATDVFLAEVRASGVEMFAERKHNEMMSLHPDTHAVGSIAAEMSSQVKQLREFAAQLRKGVQS